MVLYRGYMGPEFGVCGKYAKTVVCFRKRYPTLSMKPKGWGTRQRNAEILRFALNDDLYTAGERKSKSQPWWAWVTWVR